MIPAASFPKPSRPTAAPVRAPLPQESAKDAARRLAGPMLDKGFKPEALHTYRDASGTPIYSRIRAKHPGTGEKWIRPMHRNGDVFVLGEPEWDGPKPLYNLQQIAKAAPDAPCYIVEGEKAADALTRLGILNTTSGGAESAGRTDWTPLKGRPCVIWPDNDEPGRNYGEDVARILRGHGCTTEFVDVGALNLPEKGDAADWVIANPGATASDVRALARAEAPQAANGRESARAHAPDGNDAQEGNDWPELMPLVAETQSKPYPIDALPGVIGQAVREVVGFVQCPDALAACSALSAASLAVQGLVSVRRTEGLSGPSSLYLMAIAESGERKTTCDGYFLSAIREWETERAEAMKPDIASHTAAVKAWEARREGLVAAIKEKARKADKSDPNGGAEQSALAKLESEKPSPLRVPRVVFGDVTPEALAWKLATGWPSAGVLSSEAGIVFGGHGMKADSVMRNLSLLNVLWEGGSQKVDRRQSESFTVQGARLTMGLAVQPETVRAFLDGTKGLARGSGFAARFLIAWPESTQGTRRYREAPANWPRLSAFHRRMTALLAEPLTLSEAGELAPLMLDLTPEAKAAWVAFHDDVEGELRPGGDMEQAKDVASKAADNAARLAAIFHAFEHGPYGAIGEEHLRAGAQIAAWHLYEARRFLGTLALPRAAINAARLEAWLLRRCREAGADSVSTRDVRQFGPGALRDPKALNEALTELAEAGRARLIEAGRKRRVYPNPALLTEGERGA